MGFEPPAGHYKKSSLLPRSGDFDSRSTENAVKALWSVETMMKEYLRLKQGRNEFWNINAPFRQKVREIKTAVNLSPC
jgi:hypothetical protein